MDKGQNALAEITVKAVILGVALSVILAAANAYLGLFAGMTVSASIPAAVVSMGVLRLFRKSNILENNIVQTAASAGESLAAGVIFTLPALIILGRWESFSFKWVAIISGFGGVLGVLFTIPLRRALIIEGNLKFPEGIATAEVLETGQKGGKGVMYIAKAAIASSLFKVGAGALGLWPEAVQGAKAIGGSIAYFGSNLSPALLSVGYIVGLNIAVLIFIGGFSNWCIAIPICALSDTQPDDITMVAWARLIWEAKTRYIGVGAMVVGGLWAIIDMRESLVRGIVSGLNAYRDMGGSDTKIDRTDKDMSMKWVLILIIASIVPLFLVYQFFVGNLVISMSMAAIMLVTGFVFSAVAAYMAGIVGSSNNPISGVTIATVLVSSLLLFLMMGEGNKDGPAAAIIIGSVVCCAAAIAGDNMQDLKAGQIVGATPWKQQVMQLVGTVSAALVLAPVLMLLQKAYGFAGQPGAERLAKPLDAPQANLMASVARGVFARDLPWTFLFIGMGVAVGIIALDQYLKKTGSVFRTPVLAVAIGFYLPFQLSVPIFAGGLIHHVIMRYRKARKSASTDSEGAGRNGLLFASGLITGEALTGILLAIPIVLLKKLEIALPLMEMPLGGFLGVALLVGVALWLYKTALQDN